MKPAVSVILLTTLIGVGQGMFMALYCAELFGWVGAGGRDFFVYGALTACLFLLGGLAASFFHLGRPERAWRAAAMWRTSWLSREVIVLPIAILAVAGYGAAHYAGDATPDEGSLSLWIGALGAAATLLLFLCTGMIYACIRFLQEWASPLTVINFTLLGLASGFVLAGAHGVHYAPGATTPISAVALGLLATAFLFKLVSLWRNGCIKPKATLQTAIGVRHNKIRQQSVGFMGGSFNTREFFHGTSPRAVELVLRTSLVLVFLIPAILCAIGLSIQTDWILVTAFIVHYTGLLLERWHFFAQARHPQNLYYQCER